MNRFLGRLVVATMLFGAITSTAEAQRRPHPAIGVPQGYKPGATVRVAVWYDGDSWHVATATAKKLHQFRGEIEVFNGTIANFTPQKLEGGGKTADAWKLSRSQRKMTFDFSTKGVADGVSFQLSPTATNVQFTVYVDGKAQPMLIHVGQNANRPQAATFTLPAFPR